MKIEWVHKQSFFFIPRWSSSMAWFNLPACLIREAEQVEQAAPALCLLLNRIMSGSAQGETAGSLGLLRKTAGNCLQGRGDSTKWHMTSRRAINQVSLERKCLTLPRNQILVFQVLLKTVGLGLVSQIKSKFLMKKKKSFFLLKLESGKVWQWPD